VPGGIRREQSGSATRAASRSVSGLLHHQLADDAADAIGLPGIVPGVAGLHVAGDGAGEGDDAVLDGHVDAVGVDPGVLEEALEDRGADVAVVGLAVPPRGIGKLAAVAGDAARALVVRVADAEAGTGAAIGAGVAVLAGIAGAGAVGVGARFRAPLEAAAEAAAAAVARASSAELPAVACHLVPPWGCVRRGGGGNFGAGRAGDSPETVQA
jgi:hypothetical protein